MPNPLIASGGAGEMQHFTEVFSTLESGGADADGGLAASIFHKGIIAISDLKSFLRNQHIEIRP